MTTPASNIHVLEPREPHPPNAPTPGEVWKRRIFLILEVLFFLEAGLILTIVPWTRIWTENSLLSASFTVRHIAESGFLRGAVSGLGLINLWIAVTDAVNYHE